MSTYSGYFNPRTPRGVRPFPDSGLGWCQWISIHAPREGCDRRSLLPSMLPLNFNPRTPRGVRHIAARNFANAIMISIHAPREGCDRFGVMTLKESGKISIHAPREGCDPTARRFFALCSNFNPRTPRGVRPRASRPDASSGPFQSTHPARGATKLRLFQVKQLIISIHAPREGCDALRACLSEPGMDFNPRTPRGVRLDSSMTEYLSVLNFNPRTPRGVRRRRFSSRRSTDNFNPRTPRGVRLAGIQADFRK